MSLPRKKTLGILATLGLSLVVATGCAGEKAQRQFNMDYGCGDSRVRRVGETRFRVTGCGADATYECLNGSCTLEAPPEVVVHFEVPPEQKSANRSSVAHREKKAGVTSLALDVRLDGNSVLRFRANPEKTPDVVSMKVVYSSDYGSGAESCKLSWMIDGQKLEMPKTKTAHRGGMLTHSVQLRHDLVKELATAQRLALKSCDQRWSVADAQMAEVHRFIEMYEEDLAWQGDARSAGTGGFLAPSGGWPAWKGPSIAPSSAQEGGALEGTELFKRLAPSVFQVIAKGSALTRQGSAIAISTNELLTNCHVVAGAVKVTLQQDKAERVAKLTSADPATDRCVLGVEEPTLTPVGGVRSYESLQVGEALFTLGSPSGLELSLANGLLSGKREEDGRNYVQTTAPVSPGSSGGGLFDARGNLVGITTKINVGRTGLNQALNFAIPADEFWKTAE
jgi:hypothetical protein